MKELDKDAADNWLKYDIKQKNGELNRETENIQTYSVFLVEDDEIQRFLYKRILHSSGYKVVATSKNGLEAISKFKKLTIKPDIIVMDYNMPGKNGIEVGNAIREIDPEAKILILSANREIKDVVIKNHMKFLEKSFTLKNLLKMIQTILSEKL